MLSVSMSKFPVGFCAIASPWPLPGSQADGKVSLSIYPVLLCETVGSGDLIYSSQVSPEIGICSSVFTEEKTEVLVGYAAHDHRSRNEPTRAV